VLGNKADLEEQRKVEKAEVDNYCKSKNVKHIEVSAKSGIHVNQAFQEISEVLTQLYPKEEKTKDGNPIVEDIKKKRKEFQLQAGKQSVAKNQKQCCI
jgi:50S ribosomal subunit-associated GTPase HflX